MNWRQWFAHPVRAIVTVIVILVAAPVAIAQSVVILSALINTLAGPLLLAGIIIFAFRKMTRL